MTIQEAYNKIVPWLEYAIVVELFTAYGTKEIALGNVGQVENQVNFLVDSNPHGLSASDAAALKQMLMEQGTELFNYYDGNINALTVRKEELAMVLPTMVQEAPDLWRDILDQSRMTDAEREYAEWEESQRALNEMLGDDLNQKTMTGIIGNMMSGEFYGIAGNPTIGARTLTGNGSVPIFQVGVETNLYSDPHIQASGQTWLQDIQLRLVELGLLGDYIGDEDRTIFTPNQLDQATIRGLRDLMSTLNRGGQYLPAAQTLLSDFKEAGLDIGGLEKALASNDTSAIAAYLSDVAASPEMKSIFHNYLVTGADNLIKEKRKLGADMQIIVTPSFQSRIADAKTTWQSITGSMMNPYLAAVAAKEIGQIYEDVQLSEGKYMSQYGTANSIYKKAQQDRITGNAPSSVVKPMSNPLDFIEQKISESITKMAVEDNAAYAEGNMQRNYGTNLWAILSNLG